MPRLKVDREGALSLATALVNIASGIIENLEHGDETITVAVGSTDVAVTCANAVHSETDTASKFTDDRTLLQGVIDSVDGVFSHGKKETGAHLWHRGTRVEESGSGVSEPLLAHQIVSFEG